MTSIARLLCVCGYVLRSGGAPGADSAFEAGVHNSLKEIWLPWPNFNGNRSKLFPSADAFTLAKKYHPKWNKLYDTSKKLHARNGHQILGADLQTPTDFVVCWTSDGKASGGTGQALRIAADRNITIYNLFNEGDRIMLQQRLDEIKKVKFGG